MADKPSASARTAASADTKTSAADTRAATAARSNEALDATAAAVPAGTRDVNIMDSTPSGPVQTTPREAAPTSQSASTLRVRKVKDEVADEEKVSVVLKVKVPTMGLKVGDKVDLPASYAKRLLTAGDAMTPEDAEAYEKVEALKRENEARAAKAEADAKAQREKLRASEVEAAAEARADIEARRVKAAEAEAKARKGK